MGPGVTAAPSVVGGANPAVTDTDVIYPAILDRWICKLFNYISRYLSPLKRSNRISFALKSN